MVKSIHGDDGGLQKTFSCAHGSLWIEVVKSTYKLLEKGINLLSLCKKKVGNGAITSFWNDIWMGDTSFKVCYSRNFFP